jgi:hypothetical protein
MLNDLVTVKELIEILKTFPEHLPVPFSGYGSGYEHFYHPRIAAVIHCPENMYYNGEYQAAGENETAENIQVVVFERMVRND